MIFFGVEEFFVDKRNNAADPEVGFFKKSI